VNDYLPWPKYKAGKHMPFRGAETYHQREPARA